VGLLGLPAVHHARHEIAQAARRAIRAELGGQLLDAPGCPVGRDAGLLQRLEGALRGAGRGQKRGRLLAEPGGDAAVGGGGQQAARAATVGLATRVGGNFFRLSRARSSSKQ
jgi:hypothetical protein